MRISGSGLAIVLAIGACGTAFSQEKTHDEMAGPDTKGSVEAEMRLADTNKDEKIFLRSMKRRRSNYSKQWIAMATSEYLRQMDAVQKPARPLEGGHGHHKGES